MKKNIRVYSSKSELIKAVANKIINTIKGSVQEKGRCYLALAGGNTPRDVYSLLAKEHDKNPVSWNQVHLFWGDERTVPPEHPDSNYAMAKRSFLDQITIPPENIHRIEGEMEPERAAEKYEKVLHDVFKDKPPRFDLILLGVGEDGHTASLFPETEALDVTDRLVTAVFVPKLNSWRVTLTLPLLNAAREVVFMVSGGSKSKIIQQIMTVRHPTKELPATLVHPENGRLTWMLDFEAGTLIEK